ncbi:hypothetical protein [Streptomyces sp. NPDC021356]|uniref:hypothetical protein n=1 Tax=Streptomyces sp. NPDC021356 TaxID=3154900 RepID=UPI0033F515FE
MEIAELVLKYLQTLAWPAVAFGALWSLRVQLRAAVARMTRVETPAGSIEFAAEVRDVLHQAEGAATGARSPLPPPPPLADMPPADSWGRPASPWDTGTGTTAGASADEDEAPDPEPAYAAPGDGTAYDPTAPPVSAVPAPRTPDHGDHWGPALPSLPGPAGPRGGGAEGTGPTVSQRLERLRYVRDTADSSPRTAIRTAWLLLSGLCEDVVGPLVDGRAFGPPYFAGGAEAGFSLRLERIGLSPGSVVAFDRLRKLHDRAGTGDTGVTPLAARDFVDSCLTLAREIAALANH